MQIPQNPQNTGWFSFFGNTQSAGKQRKDSDLMKSEIVDDEHTNFEDKVSNKLSRYNSLG